VIRVPRRHRQTDGQTGNLPWHNRALRVKISIKTTKMEVGIKRKQQRNIPVIRITLPTFNINNIMLIIIVVYGVRQVAYFGSVDKVVTHFSSLGLHCAPHYNPADFISTSSSFTSLSTTCVSCDVSVIIYYYCFQYFTTSACAKDGQTTCWTGARKILAPCTE